MTRLSLALLLTLSLSTSLVAAPTTTDSQADEKKEVETKKADAKVPGDDFLHKHPTLVKMWHHSNEVRGRYQLPAQRISPELTKAAQDHAWYMARTGQFSHSVNGGFVSRARRHQYPGSPYGEIILYGSPSIPECFNGWLNSPGHRAILLSGAREVGYGYAIGRNGTAYWVGVFGN
ncbi:CAP domain-containing protein [Bremerella sp. P1]|uniref:CAP domain-containing protein n=1 Tax=Bremerella sp. P1 TaxID=3026424 RepID=UPI002368B0D5|nr:CAP domain-containing protein [Bremerella sp. P1]WDI41147.1 CAP domain-containing protein [Bremerella sp. P1]